PRRRRRAVESGGRACGRPWRDPVRLRARRLGQRLHRAVADRLTGVLLVGGASTRFGSPKALAHFDGETLAERAWRILGEACDERIAVGKGDEELPFPVLADGVEERAAIHGLVAGLRAARTDVCVVLPVDTPNMTAAALRTLADACLDAAVS